MTSLHFPSSICASNFRFAVWHIFICRAGTGTGSVFVLQALARCSARGFSHPKRNRSAAASENNVVTSAAGNFRFRIKLQTTTTITTTIIQELQLLYNWSFIPALGKLVETITCRSRVRLSIEMMMNLILDKDMRTRS